MNKEELKIKKNKLHNRLYMMMIEIIFIFGVPALIAVFVGGKIDTSLSSGRQWTIIALVIAFVLSWVFLIMRVKKIGKDIKEVENQLKDEVKEISE